jgi:4-diphosphocytidyl-2-C-methyl-D-erythritol kinase
MSVRVFAPAKINLTLEVGHPRADGLHPLQSVVMFADVGDLIEAADAEAITLSISGEFSDGLAADDSNLVLRAARTLAAHAGGARGAALSLEKNLPVASGIGGGSSDAAATLKALNQLWALNLSSAELANIGASLGADVPVCLAGTPAYMSGIGEQVAPIAAPSLPSVLINPMQPLATADVYRAFDSMGLGDAFKPRAAPHWTSSSDAIADITRIGNHLERPARSLLRQIDDIFAMLNADQRVAVAAMSGSGATVFALAASMEAAAAIADDVQQRHPDWWVADTLLGGA